MNQDPASKARPGPGAEPDRRPPHSRHLRLTVLADARRLRVAHIEVIDQPVVVTPRVIGTIVSEISAGAQWLLTEAMPDPFEERGFGTMEQGGHARRRTSQALIPIRVPIIGERVPQDLQVKLYRAKTGLPTRSAELHSAMAARKVKELEPLGVLTIDHLRQYRGWSEILKRARLSDAGAHR